MNELDTLLDAVRRGEAGALNALVAGSREYLRTIIELRMDRRLRGRLDESDVVQEACLIVAKRVPDYLSREPMEFRPWLRRTAIECLGQLQRQHLGAECRAVGRETHLTDDSVLVLADRLLPAAIPSPSEAVRERERAGIVRCALEALSEDDREIILIRTYEGLTNGETAEALAIHPDAASKRFARALLRLRRQLKLQGLSSS